ncbi:MAG: hypothetical protein VKL39_00875 [Leptolyngbyaceae bacterium]|nr:hypothetical protein [Leptolyngbyaceae bacterium]
MQRLSTQSYRLFLMLLGITLAVWILRGLGILTFIPGGLIWLLILGTIGSGTFAAIQRSKRW